MNSSEQCWAVREGTLRGYEWGLEAERPTIVALHGWLDNARSFECLQRQLPGFHIIAPDLPGHGRSDWLSGRGDYSIWSSSEALYDLIGGLRKPVILIGHSMGGAAAMLYAGAFPEHVRAYIAIDSIGPLTTPAEQTPAQLAQAISHPGNRPAQGMASVEDAVSSRLKLAPLMSRQALTPIIERNLIGRDGQYQWSTDPRLRLPSRVRLTEEQVTAFIRAIQCPTLLIKAEQGILPSSLFDQRAKSFQCVQQVSLPGHHHLHMEEESAAAVARSILQFLDDVL